ncbi:MAG: inorganic phosphate transporter [Peptococcaceae bacterium]
MSDLFLTPIFLVILMSLVFDFTNGFHDTANVVAASIATKALKPRWAILLTVTMNFLGALVFNKVAQTIANGIVDPQLLQNNTRLIIPALFTAIAWNLITWFFGLPSSSAHALVGALIGAIIAVLGTAGINFKDIIVILKSLFFSPLFAFLTGFFFMISCQAILFYLRPKKINKYFFWFQRFSVIGQAFAHGANDAQKTMGLIVLALVAEGYQHSLQTPWEVRIAVAVVLALGTATGGWRIINTVSEKITRIEPVSGFIADFSSAVVISGATFLGLPVSTTHIASMSIAGTGIAKGPTAVNWNTVLKLILTWGTTLPATIFLGAITTKLIFFIF